MKLKHLLYSGILFFFIPFSHLSFADDSGAPHGHTPEQLQTVFLSMDQNKDGFLDRKELTESAREQFKTLDIGNDGWISKEEFVGGMLGASMSNGISDINLLKPAIPGIERIFSQKDLNKDARLDLSEFAVDIVDSYLRLDANGDGKLSLVEWQAQLQQKVASNAFAPSSSPIRAPKSVDNPSSTKSLLTRILGF